MSVAQLRLSETCSEHLLSLGQCGAEGGGLGSGLEIALAQSSGVCPFTCRGKALPLQPVWCLLHSEGEPAAPYQAALWGEALQMSLLQLRLPPARCTHWPPPNTLGSVTFPVGEEGAGPQ